MIRNRLNKQKLLYKGILLIYTIALLLVASHNSPKYTFNSWCDTNIIFTVGKSLWSGKVVYRDLFEQKGPLMYFVYGIGYLISNSNYFGIFLFELVSFYIFEIYAYKILKLIEPKIKGITLPFIFYVIAKSPAFSPGGSAEELCLPLLTVSFYLGLKFLKEKEVPDFRSSVLIGILSAIVFWIKYSITGMFFGAVVPVVVLGLKSKRYKELGALIGGVFTGFMIVTIPVFIFYSVNHAFSDLFNVYFTANLEGYAYRREIHYQGYYALIAGINDICSNVNIWIIILLGFIFYCLKTKDKYLIAYYLCSSFLMTWLIYGGGRQWDYYALPLRLYMIFFSLIEVYFPFRDRHYEISCAVLILMCTYAISAIGNMNFYKGTESLVQYKMSKYINENNTLLVYGTFDIGFYTACDVVPSEYHFNAMNGMVEECDAAQKQYVREGRTDFVISHDEISGITMYEKINEEDGWFLYRRIN